MTGANGNKSFTAADIERYHNGEMTPGERHALELASLDDPFLSDAIEGYLFTPSPSADMIALRERFAGKDRDTRKVVALFPRRWMQAAAVLILLAGVGWFALRLAENRHADDVAMTPKEVKEKMNTVIADSSSIVPGTVAANSRTADKLTETTKPERLQLPNAPTQTYTYRWRNNANLINDEKKDNYTYKNDSLLASATFSTNAAQAEVQTLPDSMSWPSVTANNTYSERKWENAKFKATIDSTPRLADNSILIKRSADTIRNVDVVLTPTNAGVQEVIVSKGRTLPSRAAEPMVTIDTLEPTVGWAKFDEYIANNIRRPEGLDTKETLNGEVELTFDVNRQGEAVNIAIAKSSCSKCDEEAVRLLKQGPKWKNKKNKKGKVTIHF